ncbi:Mth938-like domain-containing protein [Nonomuraea sp. NPDC048901]|uniref:Mth938-like domain-containing protein n=1 Tax=Nonomuraea sp. NPDC048901 TaxID=3155627 RepID=UPI0033E15B7B
MERRSPLITHVSWGRMVVEGLGEGKDFKLYPGGGRAWDWNETGTRHTPGIQPADIQELLDNGSHAIVLSRGMRSLLQTCPETLDLLMEKGIEIYVEETTAAVQRYNAMVETTPVGGLIHSTC